ncbi:glutamine--fructose-6-phosphate transaminase (isomerizing) [candidate division WOR-3 bacterium]|nr:glutamine--fructose-6-phosphate transaminase (isomerizing) [candidate division WOR-3 bacterium]
MCGIVGSIGKEDTVSILIKGLKRLEYRGYDSAGIAVIDQKGLILVEKRAGKVKDLENEIGEWKPDTNIGIAHTRWATHGEPNELNAHPLMDCKNRIALVHNGIIENYGSLKKILADRGHFFRTETDTEVLAHLIEEFYEGNLFEAVRQSLQEVEGTYGIAVISSLEPDKIIIARHGSPLAIGHSGGGMLVASDTAAIVDHTNKVVYLEDREIAQVSKDNYKIETIEKVIVTPKLQIIETDIKKIEKGGYSHFMLKEINEQTQIIKDSIRGRLDRESGTARLDGLDRHKKQLIETDNLIILGCGTSYYAGLIGGYVIERNAGIQVNVEYASEFRYKNPVVRKNSIAFAISQSGETADTLAAMREASRKGAVCLGICNVVGSTIARESEGGVYIHAGPEIGVASTKAFSAQVMVLNLISLLLGRMRIMSYDEGKIYVDRISEIPQKIKSVLDEADCIKEIAKLYSDRNNFLYLGRGFNFPVALEGALKLKEISYVHAEGYPAAEMKHGPIALIDKEMPVVVIAIKDSVYSKVLGNIEEVKARKGKVIAIATEKDSEIQKKADHVIYVPETIDSLYPLLTVLPMQLLAYYIAVERGCSIDQPRNLAKSVTVE